MGTEDAEGWMLLVGVGGRVSTNRLLQALRDGAALTGWEGCFLVSEGMHLSLD